MTTTLHLTVCDAVLDIQELQDMIRSHLTTRDLKTCSLVCRQWNSHFDPYLWRRLTIWRKRQKRHVLKRHGIHVKDLRCLYFDKSTLKVILRHCPNIEQIYLRLNQESMWIQYKHLEALFIRLQDQLTNVHILFDAAFFEPAFLWCLSKLTRLKHLRVDPHALEDRDPTFSPSEYYISMLECCPSLRTLTFYYGPYFGGDLNDDRWTRSALKKWVRGILDPRRQDRLPLSAQDALVRRAGTSGGAVSTTPRINPEKHAHLKQGSPIPQIFSLRSLQLQPPVMNLPTFLRIIRQSPSIQSLALGGQWSDFHPEIWTELSALCPHLRELDIKFYGAIKDFPTMATLVTLFPRLESVLLIRQLFSKDPDFSTLDATLQRHKQLYGTPHPFKSLEITGTIRQQFPIIMDALTLPVALESFKIGNIIRHSRFLQTDPLPTPPISLARMLELTSTNASPWPCHASLTTLDISSAIFPNYASTFHFFGLLQEFTRLRTLHFWLFHLRDMICHVDSVKNPSEEDAASPLETTDGNSGDNSTPLVDVSDINNNNINGSNNPSDSNTGDNNTNDNNTVDNNTSDNSASDNNTNDNSISESNNNSISLITSNAILINSNFSSSSISLESISTSSSTNSNSNSSSSLNPSSSGNTRVQSLTLNFPTLRKVHVAPVFEMVRSGLGPAITIHEARLLIEAMPFMVQFDLSSCAGTLDVEVLKKEFPALKIQH